MRRLAPHRMHRLLLHLGVIAVMQTMPAPAEAQTLESANGPVVSLLELQRRVESSLSVVAVLKLEGEVLWSAPGRRTLLLQDASGARQIITDRRDPFPRAGERLKLDGAATIAQRGPAISVTAAPVVINDGIHAMREKSGKVYLHTGRQPVRVDWFNRTEQYGLEVQVEGPGLSRRDLDQVEHAFPANADPNGWTKGWQYRAFNGSWVRMPDLESMIPVGSGISQTLDLNKSRIGFAALEFTGYLTIPEDGAYTFYTTSDDGSLLFAGESSLKWEHDVDQSSTNQGERPIQQSEYRWAEIEGAVSFVNEHAGGLDLELVSSAGRRSVEIAEGDGLARGLLANGRVRVAGLERSVHAPDGSTTPGPLLVQNRQGLQLLEVSRECWLTYPVQSIKEALQLRQGASAIIHLRGKTHSDATGSSIADETGSIRIEPSPPFSEGQNIDALGRLEVDHEQATLGQAIFLADDEAPLPLLTKADQVRQLNPTEAQREYPVSLRGVITCLLNGEAAIVQDATSGIYFEDLDLLLKSPTPRPEIGAYYQIEGVTAPGNFSPIILAKRMTYLGPGRLPEPRQTRWDQLMNGSLDSQYVELSGVVTDIHDQGITLFTDGGVLRIEFDNFSEESLHRFKGGVVRIRGCLLALWDELTHLVKSGDIRLFAASIDLDQPAPADPFSARTKTISELRLFDAKAGAYQRIKVSGQIIHRENDIYYLTDGTVGLRFQPNSAEPLELGDLVDVVGFPELGGSSPMLRDAIARRTGHRELAKGKKLSSATMFDADRDATLVRLEARLVNVHETITGEVLELETGTINCLATLSNGSHGVELPPIGSRIEVTGVYAAQGRAVDSTRGMGFFEILLNSKSDVHVLERAPWWTPRRTLAALALLAVILFLAAIWIAMLRKRVEEKTSALKEEIDGHKRTEEQLEKKTQLLENEVEERKSIEDEMQRIHELLVRASRDAGMAEVATGVLHNAGNVLNGANLSLTFLIDRVKALPSTRLEKIVALLRSHAHEMEQFLSTDHKGRMIPEFLEKLLEQNIGDRAALLAECESLRKSLDHLNQVVAMQQDYASQVFGLEEPVRVEDLIEDALKITASEFLRRRVSVERSFESAPSIRADKHRVLQVLVNLLKNAAEACSETADNAGKVRVRIATTETERVVVEVEDNGVGIPAQNLSRIFGQGFTTRCDGRGFGLHSSALIAQDIGGNLTVVSEGTGKGARFSFSLPLTSRVATPKFGSVLVES